MARLPVTGSDDGVWGDVLNDFLSVEHNADGTLKLRDTVLETSDRGVANGVASLDGSTLIPAANMRMFNDRGVIAASTTYNRWDTVVYKGRRILVTQTSTSGSGANPFFSAANYISLEGEHGAVKAWDFGFRCDGAQSSAAANTTALQNAVNYAAQTYGRVILPAGYGYIGSPGIDIPSRVVIQGAGPYSTVIQLADNSNCHMFRTHTSSNGTSDPNGMWDVIADLCLDGRKFAQNGAGPYYGIYCNTNPFNTVGGSDLSFDSSHMIFNVQVRNSFAEGIYINGRSDVRLIGCKVSFSGGNAYRLSFDTHADHCVAEGSAGSGFVVGGSSTQLTGCKAYTCGTGTLPNGAAATKDNAHGFVVNAGIGEITFSGCDAQQTTGHGFYLGGGATGVIISGCTVAEPSFTNSTNCYSIYMDNTDYNVVQATSKVGNGVNGLHITATADHNDITLTHTGIPGASSPGSVLTSGSSVASSNRIAANGDMLSPIYEKTSNKGTANGYAGLDANGQVPASQLPVANGGEAPAFGVPRLVVPAFTGNMLASSNATLTASRVYMVRVTIPKTGNLRDLSVYVQTSSGNVIAAVYDTGDTATGSYTRLWQTGSIACPGSFAWQILGDPNLAVTVGQQLNLALMVDNTTASFGTNGFATGNISQLPAGFAPATGGALPKLVGTYTPGSFAMPTAIVESGVGTNFNAPVLIARIS